MSGSLGLFRGPGGGGRGVIVPVGALRVGAGRLLVGSTVAFLKLQ